MSQAIDVDNRLTQNLQLKAIDSTQQFGWYHRNQLIPNLLFFGTERLRHDKIGLRKTVFPTADTITTASACRTWHSQSSCWLAAFASSASFLLPSTSS
jgi:hypothetical protein